MERLHFTMRLKEGRVDEYERRHGEVWPGLVADLHAAGWRNYTLFRKGLSVHGYAECHPDIATAQAAMATSEANAEWQAWFLDIIDQTVEGGPVVVANEVWHMREQDA